MARITFIARMTVRPDKQSEFVALCRELVTKVRAGEPDVLIYDFFKLREENRFAVLESFPNEAVEHRHMNSALLAEFAPRISACLDGTWVREFLDDI